MFAKPRPPRALKPLIPLDSNGNPIQAQTLPRSPSASKGSTPTKKAERVKFNVIDSFPFKKPSNFRTSPRVAPPSFTEPVEDVDVSATESTLLSPRLRTQRIPFPKLEIEGNYDNGNELVRALQILQEVRKVQLEDRPISGGSKKKESSADLKFEFSTVSSLRFVLPLVFMRSTSAHNCFLELNVISGLLFRRKCSTEIVLKDLYK